MLAQEKKAQSRQQPHGRKEARPMHGFVLRGMVCDEAAPEQREEQEPCAYEHRQGYEKCLWVRCDHSELPV